MKQGIGEVLIVYLRRSHQRINLWTFIRSHVTKQFSGFHIQYNDKWFNLLFSRVNTFSIYNCFLRVIIRNCFYSGESFRSFVFRVYKRWFRPSLINTQGLRLLSCKIRCFVINFYNKWLKSRFDYYINIIINIYIFHSYPFFNKNILVNCKNGLFYIRG
uniref:Uncharacterized protein n=1 Tax=Juglanconis juglandina TaxID=1940567 RepID=A0A291LJ44_9PEZI|nr:hypothetical protein [Juglanconis juglandina]